MTTEKTLKIEVDAMGNNAPVHPYLDPALPVEARVNDLIGRMNLTEKIGQMCQYTGEVSAGDGSTIGLDDLTVKLVSVEEDDYAKRVEAKATLVRKGLIGSFLKVPGIHAANYLQKVAEDSRLRIPLLIATDAIHGHGMYTGPATIFPSQLGVAATFDMTIAERMAFLTRAEMRATGYHWTFSPNVEIVRDQRWGRSGETFGEDTLLATQMGRAMVRGYQGANIDQNSVLACVKHMAGGGEAFNGINAGEADISERTLLSIHLPPFEACIQDGCFTLMPAHNALNGVPCHAHKTLLTDILRNRWGFKGFVVSDWMDIERLHSLLQVASTPEEASGMAVNAGLDVHMQGPGFLEHIERHVESGIISEARIDAAVRPILTAKFNLGLFENRYVAPETAEEELLCEEHKVAALDMARRSVVLAKNENGLLPLDPKLHSLLITGPSADAHFQLGDWSRPQPAENIVTVLKGIKNIVSTETRVEYFATTNKAGDPFVISDENISKAAQKASECEYAIVVAGENACRFGPYKTAGENCDFASLALPGDQLKLIQAIYETGTPVIVVLINTRALAVTWCAENVPAMLVAWEPGLMGGQAIAEILFGAVNPSGRMPISFPRSSGHLKCYYNSTPLRCKTYGDSTAEPLFSFGHGLSYTTFTYSNLQCPSSSPAGRSVTVTVDVTNTGTRDGEHTVLLYVNDEISSVVTPVKELKAFKRVCIRAGESQTVSMELKAEAFALVNEKLERIIEPGDFTIMVDRLTRILRITA